jgi:methylmalonyl-CoA mutase N-terminal domain/subunit
MTVGLTLVLLDEVRAPADERADRRALGQQPVLDLDGDLLGARQRNPSSVRHEAHQRGRIQDESMRYEHKKHDGSLPIIGVNTFRSPGGVGQRGPIELARGTDAEKQSQLDRLADFHARHQEQAEAALQRLRDVALAGDNVFACLMDAARVCSLGQITEAFFEVGGQYRRNI